MSRLLPGLLILSLLLSGCYTQLRDPTWRSYPGSASSSAREGIGPSDGTLILIVDAVTMQLEVWTLVAPSPWPGGGRELEIEWASSGDVSTVQFRYPKANAMIFEASTVWNGTGRVEFPREWRSFEALPRGRSRATPTWIRLYSPTGPGQVVSYAELPYAHERGDELLDLWHAVSDRELVSDWVEHGAWVGAYAYHPSAGGLQPRDEKWIVFVRP